ncbi:MAG: hypothetical protein GXP30_04655, partial [Verrucomicrobia bacterium]|nr:hypothetical protein [Verrucomicrobiota bacterium]
LILFFAITLVVACGEILANPVEVGLVEWGRDLEAALNKSAETGKPVFVLFQEIPGCAGCQKFGRTVLSNPLLVEAIEENFIPMLVYNNRSSGMDKQLLKRFKEPAWNYQVVRFLNAEGKDVILRKDRIWTLDGIAARMIEALKTAKQAVPKYLKILAIESNVKNHAVSAFAMHCFWTGEMEIGKIEGVVSTEAGWMEGREVTRVVYDKSKITLQALAQKAYAAGCANKVYAGANDIKGVKNFSIGKLDDSYRRAKASDQSKQLTAWRAIRSLPGLTEMQLTKINAYATSDRPRALTWLSPKQRRALEKTGQGGRSGK